jgi:hypothetical protein
VVAKRVAAVKGGWGLAIRAAGACEGRSIAIAKHADIIAIANHADIIAIAKRADIIAIAKHADIIAILNYKIC